MIHDLTETEEPKKRDFKSFLQNLTSDNVNQNSSSTNKNNQQMFSHITPGKPSMTSTAAQVTVVKPTIPSTQSSTAGSVTKKAKKTPLKESPHVLIWVCAAGKGRGKSWGKALKCVGVYATKQAAEEKKTQLM